MKKFLSVLLLWGSVIASPMCAPDLQPALNILYRSSEARKVIDQAEKEGKIKIYRTYFHSGSSAMWNSEERAIVINNDRTRSYGEMARSILFELHNALSTKEFSHLDRLAMQRKISRSDYIEAVERVEHRNALKTVALIEKGIQGGIFPREMYWPIPKNFEVHFNTQKQCGHSQAIAVGYDYLVDYDRLRYMAWQSHSRR